MGQKWVYHQMESKRETNHVQHMRAWDLASFYFQYTHLKVFRSLLHIT